MTCLRIGIKTIYVAACALTGHVTCEGLIDESVALNVMHILDSTLNKRHRKLYGLFDLLYIKVINQPRAKDELAI